MIVTSTWPVCNGLQRRGVAGGGHPFRGPSRPPVAAFDRPQREALIEREVLLRAAPHIIWPMRFVLPHSPEQRPAWLVRLGLFLYDHLGGRKKLPGTRMLDLSRDPEGTPLLDRYTKGFEYSDC